MSETKLATKADLKEMYDRMLPYMGGMPEILANKFSKGDLYSTDEKMIGQWIDGKPLYQRTLQLRPTKNYPANTVTEDTLYTDESVDELISMKGTITFTYGDYLTAALPYSTTIYQQYNFIPVWNQNQNALVMRIGLQGGSAYAPSEVLFVITLQYTKPTDSAVSIGSDTDYSTDEKIVGTWIDGKPIYSKTYTGTTPSTVSSSEPLNVPMEASIERVIDAKVVFFNSNGSHYVGALMTITSMDKGIRFSFESNLNPTVPNIYRIYCTQESWCNLPYYLTVFYTKTTS